MAASYVASFVRFGTALLILFGLLGLLNWSQPEVADWTSSVRSERSVTSVTAESLGATARSVGKGLTLALPAALVLGTLAGLRPGSRVDRLLRAPAVLVAGVPIFIFCFLAIFRLPDASFAQQVTLITAVGLGAWGLLGVRDGLAATGPGATAGRRVAGALGGLLRQGGSMLLAVMVVDSFYPVGFGLLRALDVANQPPQKDLPLTAGLLVAMTVPVLILHLLGDLLAGAHTERGLEPERELEPEFEGGRPLFRMAWSWIALGGFLSAVLVVSALLSFEQAAPNLAPGLLPPGPEHPLGTDRFGRDLLAVTSAGVRLSLLIGLGAAGVALALGALLGRAGMRRPLLTPPISLPGLHAPFLAGIWAYLITGPRPLAIALFAGIAAGPAIAGWVRQAMLARAGTGRKQAWLGVLGALVLVLGQVLAADVLLAAIRYGLPTAQPTIGSLTYGAISAKSGPHLLYPLYVIAGGVAGLFLLGVGLTEAKRR